jgi:hypothetical protein
VTSSGIPVSSSLGSRATKTIAIVSANSRSPQRERTHRRSIEPLRIIVDARKRSPLGLFGQQAKHRERDREPIRRVAFVRPERHPSAAS